MLHSIKSNLIMILLTIVILYIVAIWGFYAYVLDLIHEKEEVYVRNSITQVIGNIQTSAKDMSRFAKMASNSDSTQDFLTSKQPLNRLEASKGVSNSLFSITQDSQEISIIIAENSGETVLSSKPVLSIMEQLKKDYHIDQPAENTSGFTGLMYNTYEGYKYFAYYHPILNIKYNIRPQQKIGTCVVLTPITNLQACIDQVETTPNSLFFILDQNLKTIVSSPSDTNTVPEGLLQTAQAETLDNGAVQSINGSDHMVFCQEVPYTGWKVVGAVPLSEIHSELSTLLAFGTMVLIILGIVFVVWGVHIFRSIALPVVEISKFLQGDAYVNLHKRLTLKNKNEIGILADQINQMLGKISNMTRTILMNQSNMYELDLAKKRAELSALQSQINPHFLYNTLDCIKGHGYLLNSPEIIQIVDSLSQLMRYCIKGADIVELNAEACIIQHYINIIQIRFSDRFTFCIDLSEQVRSIKIPRFILQPIVENAIYHGLEPKYGSGVLWIYDVQKSDEEIEICIEDNGVGMEPGLVEQINDQLTSATLQSLFYVQEKKGLALLNINKRIQQLFGAEYGMQLESTLEVGTIVHIFLPSKKEDQ